LRTPARQIAFATAFRQIADDTKRQGMILRERLFLANCDSVRQLSPDEMGKRLLLGAAFGEGVVMSVNLLLDNQGMADVLARPDLASWYF
jgi:hypothetical protein